MRNVLSVFGTRPEAIKMAPVVKTLEASADFHSMVCITAQHREMIDQVLDLFRIKPDYDLDIMKKNQTLSEITTRVMENMCGILRKVKPDLVLVQGDTTTAFVTALSAFYEQIPVGHIEAGLRTNNLKSPYPEEANRQLIGRLAAFHFAPTETSKSNLMGENVPEDRIFVTGNTIIDALYMVKKRIDAYDSDKLKERISPDVMQIIDGKKPYILVTCHRRENFGKGLADICSALKMISNHRPDIDIVYPVHLNPNVRKTVFDRLKDQRNIILLDPLDYLSFVALLDRSHIVLTDSGGIQEEAPSFGKPVLVMRNTTERPEAVEEGTVKLVGTSERDLLDNVFKLFQDDALYQKMSRAHNPYGDGRASEYIVDRLRQCLG